MSNDPNQPKIEDVLKRLNELENENKGLKEKVSTSAREKEEAEKKEAEKNGDLAKQLELERKEREKYEKDNKSLRTKTLKQNVREAVQKYAKDVHDIDDFLNQPQFKSIIDNGIDKESLTLSDDAAKDYANKVLEAKPWMKKNIHQPGVDDTKPKANQTTTKQSLQGKSSAEILKEMKSLKG